MTERGNKKPALVVAEELRENLEKELQLKVLDEIETKSNINNATDILFIEYLFYLLKIIEHTVESSTFTSYRQISNNYIRKYFTDHPIKLKDLEPIHIQNFCNELMEKYNLTANTVIHHHAIIRKCLDYAFKMNVIVSNPADKVQRPKKRTIY